MDLLAQMATFTRVVEAGSLSRAGRDLGLSLAAVSRQISTLEQSLGAALIVRTTRKLQVTDAGARYYERCARVLHEVELAQGSVKRGRRVEGTLTVTAPVTLGLARVNPHLPSFLAAHPRLRIDLRLEDRVVDLVAEGVEIAIRGGAESPDSASIVARRLLCYRRVVVASPAYLKKRGEPKTPDALAEHDVLAHLGATGPTTTWTFTRDDETFPVRVAGSFRTNAIYGLLDAAVAGQGIALLPDWIVEARVAEGALRVLLRGFETSPVIVSALHRTEVRSSPRVKAFLDHLVRAYGPSRDR